MKWKEDPINDPLNTVKSSPENVRNYSISTWVGLVAIFMVVFALGAYSYTKLNRILEEVSGAARPDLRLLAVKGIQSDIQDAENSVKTFSLTRDTSDLRRFSEIAEGIEAKLDQLLLNQTRKDDGDDYLFRLDSLVYEKFEVHRAMLELAETGLGDQTLTKLRSSLNRAARNSGDRVSSLPLPPSIEPSKTVLDTLESPSKADKKAARREKKEKKTGLFRRSKSRKNKRKADEEANSKKDLGETVASNQDSILASDVKSDLAATIPLPAEPIEQLAEELEVIRRQERARSFALTAEELELTREEQRISAQITAVVTAIEVLERQKIALRTAEAESLTREANQLIVVFCITLTLLILLLSIGIFSYFRTSKRHQKGIQEARNAALQLAKARESFLATMSHEIRTPLNAIIGFTERVLNTKLKTEQSKQLAYVKSSGNHLLEIVNDVLDFSKLEAGAMTFVPAPFSLSETLETCMNAIRLVAETKDIALRIESDSRIPEILNGDAMRLRQVLLNLLTNAVRFTDSGEISIQTKLKSKRRSKIAIEFSVVDSGVGIAEADQKAVFEEFTQANLEAGRNSGGTGLGLPICKRIVEMQGGKLWMESIPGKGTKVAFHLEFGLDKTRKESEVPIVVRDARTVLVVDDAEYNRLLLKEVLGSGGFEVGLATNGLEALECLEKDRFDLILLDIRMPEMDGVEVLKRIRSGNSAAPEDQPVIALTAAASAQEQAECKAAGCNAILGKPFKEADLWTMMGVLPAKEESPENQEETPGSLYSLTHLQAMARGNQDFVIDMVHSYLEMAQRSLEQMKVHLDEGELPELGALLHKLAPATRHLEAQMAYQSIKEMEGMISDEEPDDAIAEQLVKLEAALSKVMSGLQMELEKLKKHDPQQSFD